MPPSSQPLRARQVRELGLSNCQLEAPPGKPIPLLPPFRLNDAVGDLPEHIVAPLPARKIDGCAHELDVADGVAAGRVDPVETRSERVPHERTGNGLIVEWQTAERAAPSLLLPEVSQCFGVKLEQDTLLARIAPRRSDGTRNLRFDKTFHPGKVQPVIQFGLGATAEPEDDRCRDVVAPVGPRELPLAGHPAENKIQGAIRMMIAVHLLIQAGLTVRVLLRPHRDPASRIAWIVVILAIPLAGILAYLLLGETNIGRKRADRVRRIIADLPDIASIPGFDAPEATAKIEEGYQPLFRTGQSISGFGPVGGNSATLTPDSNATIEAMVRDIDLAKKHVHLMFYIWLPDGNGTRMAQALMRAARRGLACRAMVDDLGSRALIRSRLWHEMEAAGVKLARALPVGNPLVRMFSGRIDLRNHRKILVIDNRVTYCGSQNCADPEFLPKAKYAPWVDAVMRFEGPIVRQNQYVFAGDWMAFCDEDIRDVLLEPLETPAPGFPALVIATGPTARYSAAPEMFVTLMYSAQRELFVTTPYYVPVESIQAALCAAGNRGVDVTIVFPARNDDFAVGATSKSYYADLLAAGVKIYEYEAGLLHTKSVTLDGEVTLIGSANMDRRSFDLNYESNILLHDPDLTAAMRERQLSYLADARRVTMDEVADWPWQRRLLNNALAVVGPVL